MATTTTGKPLRLLQVTRLSRLGEDSTGIAKQDEAAERYAAAFGHAIVDKAEDTGVSGDTDPFRRPALGPWLTDPVRIGQIDGLLASHLDRLGRNVRYLAKLKDWADDNGKVVIVIDPPMTYPFAEEDFGSRVLWTMLELLSEWELDTIKRRNRDTRAKLLRENKLIGPPGWGWKAVPADDGKNKTIEPDPAREGYLLRMIAMAETLDDGRFTAIANWLDSLDDPAARPLRGGRWSDKSISQVLRNPSLKGRRMSEDGRRTLLVHKGLITPQRWDALQAILDASPKRRGPTRRDPALLTDVAFCARCRGVLHARHPKQRLRKDGTRLVYHVYRCDGTPRQPSACRNILRMDWLEAWVSTWVLSNFGDRRVVEQVLVPATDTREEQAEVERRIAALDQDADTYDADHAALRAEWRRLREEGAQPARIEPRPTKFTVGALWAALDAAKRREFLMAAGVRVYAHTRDGVWAEGDPAKVAAGLSTLRTGL